MSRRFRSVDRPGFDFGVWVEVLACRWRRATVESPCRGAPPERPWHADLPEAVRIGGSGRASGPVACRAASGCRRRLGRGLHADSAGPLRSQTSAASSEALNPVGDVASATTASTTVRMRAWWQWMPPTRVAPTTVGRGKFSNRFSPMKQASMQYSMLRLRNLSRISFSCVTIFGKYSTERPPCSSLVWCTITSLRSTRSPWV